MRINRFFLFVFITVLFQSAFTQAQTVNFDETWKEFLENNKISNMSELIKPDKVSDLPDYAKYLIMNTNTSFCQSEIDEAEGFLSEVNTIDPQLFKTIPGFTAKKTDLEEKIKAYHSIDEIWEHFLDTKQVNTEELEGIKSAKSLCEKQTLAKYSYMTAHHHFCQGNITRSKTIFETRTLRLAEKTSLRVEDVKGLAKEVSDMKILFSNLEELDAAWAKFLKTGKSPGFDIDLPVFPCNPIPNMKALVLQGTMDICEAAPLALEKIRELEDLGGVPPSKELRGKVKELENSIKKKDSDLVNLNKAWEAFIPDNKVRISSYSYDYCEKEPLIRAYVMDGFAFACDMAEEALDKIDALQRDDITPLEEITMQKINELAALSEQYISNGQEIDQLWNKFTAQGDTLYQDFESTDLYCDNIQQAKDWTISGLCGTCEEGLGYLAQIEAFQETFEFSFTDELECRVQNLRLKVWECRFQALQNMASIEVSSGSYEDRLESLMEEYNMADRPEECILGQ